VVGICNFPAVDEWEMGRVQTCQAFLPAFVLAKRH